MNSCRIWIAVFLMLGFSMVYAAEHSEPCYKLDAEKWIQSLPRDLSLLSDEILSLNRDESQSYTRCGALSDLHRYVISDRCNSNCLQRYNVIMSYCVGSLNQNIDSESLIETLERVRSLIQSNHRGHAAGMVETLIRVLESHE